MLVHLARTQTKLGQFGEAEATAMRAARLLDAAHSPDLHQALECLASIKAGLGENEEADALFQGAIQKLQDAVGSDHPDLAEYMEHRAQVVERLGRNADAVQLRQQALLLRQAPV